MTAAVGFDAIDRGASGLELEARNMRPRRELTSIAEDHHLVRLQRHLDFELQPGRHRNLVAHHHLAITHLGKEREGGNIAEKVETHVCVPMLESVEDRIGLPLGRDDVSGVDLEDLFEGSDVRAHHGHVRCGSDARDQRDPRAGDTIVNRNIVGQGIEAGEKVIGAEKHAAQINP